MAPPSDNQDDSVGMRRRWMSVLAHATPETLGAHWAALADAPDYQYLRKPETGLVMARARAGGTGGLFNLGEITVTRCSVRGSNGVIGHAYVMGRSRRHAELAAVFDAMLQEDSRRGRLLEEVIEPLSRAQAAEWGERSRKVAATKVDFLTLARD